MIVMITSIIGLIMFSIQRLNSLKLSRYIAYIFIFPNLFIMNIVMIDPLLSVLGLMLFVKKCWILVVL